MDKKNMLEAVKEKQVLLKLTNNAIAELFEIHEITWAKNQGRNHTVIGQDES